MTASGKTMVLLADMSCRRSAGFARLKERVGRFLDSLPAGWRARLVGYGVKSPGGGGYLSSQPYASTAERIMQQFREVGNAPFSAQAGDPGFAWSWLEKNVAAPSAGMRIIWFASSPERVEVRRRDVRVLPLSATAEEISAAAGFGDGASAGPARVPSKPAAGRKMTLSPRCPTGFGKPEREFNDLIVRSVRAFEKTVDISKFVQPQRLGGYGWTSERVFETYFDVLWNNPQLFYVNKTVSYAPHMNGRGEIAAGQLRIPASSFAIKPEQYETCKGELDEAAGRALATVAGVDDEAEVAKRLHDYIVKTCEYDMVARDAGGNTPRARTAYDALVRHSAVCEGYVMGYRYLLSLAGIVSEEVVSDEMNHCWNYVRIGGNWYHVDVTHDDPRYKGARPPAGYVSHKFFLLSDAAIKAKGHKGWKVRGLPPAADRRFDNCKWGAAR